jgi:mono/diheme cytochrome c family protein/glucose/arabinose dehydrogenase
MQIKFQILTKGFLYLILFLLSCVFIYCNPKKKFNNKNQQDSLSYLDSISSDFESSPFLSPEQALKTMQVEEGFEVKLVASEPLISTPVALSFDKDNRIWVVEMNGYMPDTLGTGENHPNGKIVILEDKNHDGIFDTRKVFLDSLILPRAICLIEDGILVATPPSLWYYPIINDKAGKPILVDNKYADKGNVEHQPNGLLRSLDNWIYNAKSDKRYQKRGDKWVKEHTHYRGQWGITQDNFGRLYYNNNSENLLGDYFMPGFGASNNNQRTVNGFDEKIVSDNKVYPIRPTTGVNRGYLDDILDKQQRLKNFTAACGPLIYRGGLFGKDYEENAFVAEPAANLVKRNIINFNKVNFTGDQAYQNKEFLASTDERFRPVNLHNGPDGALYVVDMYRGIIQHKTYITSYLKNEIERRDLTNPLNAGRIYKIVPKNAKTKAVKLSNQPKKLIEQLGNSNGFIRDMAQQILVDQKNKEIIPLLEKSLLTSENSLKIIHILHVLEGLNALESKIVNPLLKHENKDIRIQAFALLPTVIKKNNYKSYVAIFNKLLDSKDSIAAPYIAFLSKNIQLLDKEAANDLLLKTAITFPNSPFVAAAVISSLKNQEEKFLKQVSILIRDKSVIREQLTTVIEDINSAKLNRNTANLAREFPKGTALYNSSCQTCHGADGNGITSLAPPLNQSEWVTGSKENLISIVLFGLTGPIEVNGHLYQSPELNIDMPGIGYSKSISNQQIAELLSYIRKSWRNNADVITAEEVEKIRIKLKGREKAFTAEELLNNSK